MSYASLNPIQDRLVSVYGCDYACGGHIVVLIVCCTTTVADESILRIERDEEVACHFETQPTAGHAGCDLEQVGSNALVQAFDAFLRDDDLDGVEY